MSLWRGYVRTNGKKSIDKFKDVDNLLSLESVSKCNSYAGVLNATTILLDFDNEETSNKALEIIKSLKLKCMVVKTTRGIHAYFKTSKVFNCHTGSILACGLTADIKTGVNAYGVLKINGTIREVLYDTKEYDELPIYFYPTNQSESTLLGKVEGDRNNTLYSYILTLHNNNFNKEQIKEIITFINNYIFDDPLSDDELNTILRDEAFIDIRPNFFGGKFGNSFLHRKFTDYLIEQNHVCKINGQLHIYKNGVYVSGYDEIEAIMINYIPSLKSNNRTEVIKTLKLLSLDNKEPAPANYIAFKNGIYDLEQNKLIDFNPSIIITNQIPHNYNPTAKCDKADSVLNAWANDDPKVRSLLDEIIGMCMYRSNAISSCFMIYGKRDNGKSSFIHLLQFLLGDKNYSSISLEDIEAKFKNADIYGKLANLGDDIKDSYIPTTSTFKKLITGETVQFERKGQDPFDFKNYSKLIFNANVRPKINDPTGAVIEKRITFIPFNADFSNRKGDPHLDNIMKKADFMEYIIKEGIEGIKRVIINKGFTTCEIIENAKADYIFENDPVMQFIDEIGKENIYMKDTSPIVNQYQAFCYKNGYKCSSSQYLNKGITRLLGYEKIKRNEKQDNKTITTYYYGNKS